MFTKYLYGPVCVCVGGGGVAHWPRDENRMGVVQIGHTYNGLLELSTLCGIMQGGPLKVVHLIPSAMLLLKQPLHDVDETFEEKELAK